MRFLCLHGRGTNSRVSLLITLLTPPLQDLIEACPDVRGSNFSSDILANFQPVRYSSSKQVRDPDCKSPIPKWSDELIWALPVWSAALRYGLGNCHEFEFVQGSIPWPQAPGESRTRCNPQDRNPSSHFSSGLTRLLVRQFCG